MLPNRSKVDVPFSLLTAQQPSFTEATNSRRTHTSWLGEEQREDTVGSLRNRQIQNLDSVILNAEQRLMFYAMSVADALQCESRKAGTKFSKFSKLAEIWCDNNLCEPWQIHWRNRSHEDLWEMVNSAIHLEVKVRQRSQVVPGLERQVLASESWIAQLKTLLSEIQRVKEEQKLRIRKLRSRTIYWEPLSHAEKELRFRKVIPTLRSKSSDSRRTSPLSDSDVNEYTSADEAWNLLNRNRPVQRLTRNNDEQTLTEENRILADQIAKLLDGFQP